MQRRVLVKDIEINEYNTISGFIDTIRDKKNICFIVLRDISGKIQITIDKVKRPELTDIISKLTTDSVIKVKGVVVKTEFVKKKKQQNMQSNFFFTQLIRIMN